MQARQFEIPEAIGRRFHRPPVPSVVAHAASRHPVVFSHVASQTAMPGPTLAPPVESAFALHVHHRPLLTGDIWIDGKHSTLAPVGRSGILIFDLRTEPVAQLYEGFEFSRFHFSRAAIDDFAYEQGIRTLGELFVEHGHADPVVYHLALAMLERVEAFGSERDTLFRDSIALALLAHVAQQYGGASEGRVEVGTLAPLAVPKGLRVGRLASARLHLDCGHRSAGRPVTQLLLACLPQIDRPASAPLAAASEDRSRQETPQGNELATE